jgi:anti-sigma B factor antagonist
MSATSNSRFPLSSTPGTLEMVEATDGDIVCFVLAGEMDLSTAAGLPVRVRDALRHGARKVCIDLTAVSFIDSTALAALLNCQRGISRGNGRMTVVHNGGEVLRMFELSRIDRALDLHTSRNAALAALADGDGLNGAARGR